MSVETVEIDAETSSNTAEENENDSVPKSCSGCNTGFDKVVPKLLPCLHSFCQACLEERLRDQQPTSSTHRLATHRLKCPKCGQEFLVPSRGVASLIDNQFVLEIVEKASCENETEQHVCTSCEDNSSATSYCLNCSEWLCNACVQAHQRVRITKDHEIKSGDDLRASVKNHGRNERSLYCQKHPSEKLKLFCLKCERLTCRDCQLLEHKDHQYQFVNEAAGRYREYFKKRLRSLEEKIGPLAESIEAVQNSSTHLDHKSEVVSNEIKKSSNELISAVKQRENVLLNELQALVHFKRKMLTKQSKDLNLMQDILKHNYEFTKHAVYKGSDVSLLTSQRQLGSRIQNLLSLKYRVTPVAHSDLKFVTESIKLCNAILKAGSVMTPSNPRATLSPANMSRNPISLPNQGNNDSTIKVNPLHSLNTFNTRHGLQAATGINPKPSSKVYPNVQISSQMAGPKSIHGSTVPFPKMPIRTPLLHTMGNSHSSSTMHSPSLPNPAQSFLSSSQLPPRRMTTSPGSGIPLHHIENIGKETVPRSSPPGYEASLLRKSLSSSLPEATSSQTSNQGSTGQTRRDSSSHSNEHAPLLSSTSPIIISPSQLSPTLPKPSPNSSRSSTSPSQSSPRPTTSPLSTHPQTSPISSPLPTFLDSEFRDAAGIKIKPEKGVLPEQTSCSQVKPEPGAHGTCSYTVSAKTMPETCACGPPSNNSSNDDWCAVCHNGGELLCCDTCPKVFHLLCHVPTLTATPSDSWSCGLCQSFDGAPPQPSDSGKRRGLVGGMSGRELKRCEKMLLALFCHPDSMPFHDKVSKAVPNYYKVIHRPMDLTLIKTKLQPVHFEHYNTVNEFIADCKLIFSNCALFNDAESEVGKMGKRLAAEFQNIIQKYSPDEDDVEPLAKKMRQESI